MSEDSGTVMVTGAAGFIGSHLSEALVAAGNTVIGVDILNDYYSGKEENISELQKSPTFQLERVDISDQAEMESVLAKHEVQGIFHLAAQPGVRYSLENPQRTNQINTAGTLALLEAARKQDISWLLHASSSSVYGATTPDPTAEDVALVGRSPYAISKLCAEEYCRVFHEVYGTGTLSLRLFTVYGPRQRPDMAFRIFAEAFRRGESPNLFGDGEQSRDFTYVSDIVRGFIAAAAPSVSRRGDAINLGSGDPITMNNLITLLKQVMETDIEFKRLPEKPGESRHTYASIEKAKARLGWAPEVKLEQGLRNFRDWLDSRN